MLTIIKLLKMHARTCSRRAGEQEIYIMELQRFWLADLIANTLSLAFFFLHEINIHYHLSQSQPKISSITTVYMLHATHYPTVALHPHRLTRLRLGCSSLLHVPIVDACGVCVSRKVSQG